MKKQGLNSIVFSLLFNCFYPLMISAQSHQSLQSHSAVLSMNVNDREIYDSFFKEQQAALAAHKAFSDFDLMCEVRNVIADSVLDSQTKNALLAAFDKKLLNLERRAIDRKDFLIQFRQQQRNDALLVIFAIFVSATIVFLSTILLNSRR